jgi:hypothetical protein
MLVTLSVSIVILMYWYRKDIRLMTERLNDRRQLGLGLGPLVRVPYKSGLAVLVGMITFIALHHHIELKLALRQIPYSSSRR